MRLLAGNVLDDCGKFLLNTENGFVAFDGVVPEILNEYLRDDVEVLLLIMEDMLY